MTIKPKKKPKSASSSSAEKPDKPKRGWLKKPPGPEDRERHDIANFVCPGCLEPCKIRTDRRDRLYMACAKCPSRAFGNVIVSKYILRKGLSYLESIDMVQSETEDMMITRSQLEIQPTAKRYATLEKNKNFLVARVPCIACMGSAAKLKVDVKGELYLTCTVCHGRVFGERTIAKFLLREGLHLIQPEGTDKATLEFLLRERSERMSALELVLRRPKEDEP